MSEGPINAPALAELCTLLETPDQQLLPDAVGLGGRAALYQRLRDCEALGLAARELGRAAGEELVVQVHGVQRLVDHGAVVAGHAQPQYEPPVQYEPPLHAHLQ